MEDEYTGLGAADIARAYDIVARSYADLIPTAGGETDPETDLELAMVREFAASLPSGAGILDAGCGPGRMMSYLDTLAPLAIVGCDISRRMISLAREAHPRRIANAYGHDVELTAYRQDVAEVSTCLERSGFRVRTTLSRAPTVRERQAQGFISALGPS